MLTDRALSRVVSVPSSRQFFVAKFFGKISAIYESASSGKSLPVDAATDEGQTAITSIFGEALRRVLVDGPGDGLERCFFAITKVTR